ncbi:MAG TPA: MFS transporter [Hyphomicrobiaceae bacterium]|jgi:ACS family tartrate transporter-like MFS transporter|nr:MFS transporter [Hyphomicrobiaceae bacterium]
MITWGIFAGAMAFVTDVTSFSIVRFLLGVAEAGFFPGMLLYFTYWFPRRHHARIVSGFLVGLPVAVALGAPISTALLGLDGLFGLKGWQVMYIAEAVPTVVVGCLTLLVLTDRPEQARFLTSEEKHWLAAKLASERLATKGIGKFSSWKVLVLISMYVVITVVSLGLLNYAQEMTAWLKANVGDVPPVVVVLIPYIFGAIALLVWGRMADRNLWKAMVKWQGAAAGRELFRYRYGKSRDAVLHPADHQVTWGFL